MHARKEEEEDNKRTCLYRATNKTNKLTVELDGLPTSRDAAEVGDGDLSAVGHAACERTAADGPAAVLDVDLVIACTTSTSTTSSSSTSRTSTHSHAFSSTNNTALHSIDAAHRRSFRSLAPPKKTIDHEQYFFQNGISILYLLYTVKHNRPKIRFALILFKLHEIW